ncbi:MAG: hypothetical protein K0Q92_1891, partial [Steroidobacteraceae bacterium]|nr:hypothetical protein [Steroidobacteraceae bacterium]
MNDGDVASASADSPLGAGPPGDIVRPQRVGFAFAKRHG